MRFTSTKATLITTLALLLALIPSACSDEEVGNLPSTSSSGMESTGGKATGGKSVAGQSSGGKATGGSTSAGAAGTTTVAAGGALATGGTTVTVAGGATSTGGVLVTGGVAGAAGSTATTGGVSNGGTTVVAGAGTTSSGGSAGTTSSGGSAGTSSVAGSPAGAGAPNTAGMAGSAGSNLAGTSATAGAAGSAGNAGSAGFAGAAGGGSVAARELCNSGYATSEFSFDFAGPDATPYRVAACKLRSDLTESAKLAFSFGAACAAESWVFDIARYSNAEKHRFVSTYSQQLYDQTAYKSTASGYHSLVLRGTLSTHETYPSSSCDCNSTTYSYSGTATEARLVSLFFYQHPGCSNPGSNAVLGGVYHSESAPIIWPGYDYGDVGVLGAVLYANNDCSGCVGIAQTLPVAATQPYGVTTDCNTGTTAYLPERVICAWAPSG